MSPIRQTVRFDKKLIDSDALKIVKKLNKSDYEAYLVGGCIRDLLLRSEEHTSELQSRL